MLPAYLERIMILAVSGDCFISRFNSTCLDLMDVCSSPPKRDAELHIDT